MIVGCMQEDCTPSLLILGGSIINTGGITACTVSRPVCFRLICLLLWRNWFGTFRAHVRGRVAGGFVARDRGRTFFAYPIGLRLRNLAQRTACLRSTCCTHRSAERVGGDQPVFPRLNVAHVIEIQSGLVVRTMLRCHGMFAIGFGAWSLLDHIPTRVQLVGAAVVRDCDWPRNSTPSFDPAVFLFTSQRGMVVPSAGMHIMLHRVDSAVDRVLRAVSARIQ